MKKLKISLILLITLILSGCGDKNLTLIYFESYNQLENPKGEYQSGDEFTFEVDNNRYEIMDGYTAVYLRIIKENEDNRYKLVLVDSDRNIIFSMITERECVSEAIRECTDIDGKVYILYSKWDSAIGNLFVEDLESTHILEMDMDEYKVKQEYVFGKTIVVLTVHDGYVYTMKDGRIYRELLGETGNLECMTDLGFRGTPNVKEIDSLKFCTKLDGIKVNAILNDEEEEFGYKEVVLSDMKYMDQPIESE